MSFISPLSLSDLSPTTLGLSFVFGSIIIYATINKMLGLGSKNDFVVDGKVRLALSSLFQFAN